MDEELIARSGLTPEQLQEAAAYNDGRLRGRITEDWAEFLPEERAALVAIYQREVFGDGSAVDGKFGPATEEKARQDRDAWLADPSVSSWGAQWDSWLWWDYGPELPEGDPAPAPAPAGGGGQPAPAPTPGPGPGPGPAPDPAAPDPAPKKAKKKSMIGWVIGGAVGLGAIILGVTSGGPKKRRDRKRRR